MSKYNRINLTRSRKTKIISMMAVHIFPVWNHSEKSLADKAVNIKTGINRKRKFFRKEEIFARPLRTREKLFADHRSQSPRQSCSRIATRIQLYESVLQFFRVVL